MDPSPMEVEGHPRHPPKQRQAVARRTMAWVCMAFALALAPLFYALVRLGRTAHTAPPPVHQGSLYGTGADAPIDRSGMGRHRFPDPLQSAARRAAAAAMQTGKPESAMGPDRARGAQEPTRKQSGAEVQGGMQGGVQEGVPGGIPGGVPAAEAGHPPAVRGKCVEDYPFADCQQDLPSSCARWGDTLCRSTCTPGCGTSYESPSFETAAAALERPHLETDEVLPHPTGASCLTRISRPLTHTHTHTHQRACLVVSPPQIGRAHV